jgi:hypothetical protein
MQGSVAKGSTGSALLIVVLIIGIFLWASRRQLGNVAAGFKSPSKDGLSGEWVGLVDITGGYKRWLGDAPGKHDKAVLRFNLSIYDAIVNRYDGNGEIMIQGENKPRSVHIVMLSLEPDNRRIGGQMTGDWGPDDRGDKAYSHDFAGSFVPGTLNFIVDDNTLGLQFRGALHKGTDADYQALIKTLNP